MVLRDQNANKKTLTPGSDVFVMEYKLLVNGDTAALVSAVVGVG